MLEYDVEMTIRRKIPGGFEEPNDAEGESTAPPSDTSYYTENADRYLRN